jgi:TonB family protein
VIARLALAVAFVDAIAACGTARTADAYRADTQKLLDAHQPDIEHCYQSALANHPDLTGTVTVDFTVEHKTGAVKDVAVDAKTTAPKELGDCVVQALTNMKLDPPDRDEGKATFVFDFKPKAGSS